jgi:hypothetical protein
MTTGRFGVAPILANNLWPIKSTATARAASRASLEVAQLLALQVDGSPRSHHPVSAKLERPWWVYSVFGVDAVGIEEKWAKSSLPTSGGGLLISYFRWFGLFVFLQDFMLFAEMKELESDGDEGAQPGLRGFC